MVHGLCRDLDAPKSTDLHCVLVHGTWANDAAWVEPSSAIATALKNSEGLSHAAFYTFKWSGSVRHRERVDAALLLSSELTAEIARFPNSSWVFVAHSHGGNIVMSAAKTVPSDRLVGCVCLATPFFHVRKRSASVRRALLITSLSTFMFGGLFLLAKLLVSALTWWVGSWLGQKLSWASFAPDFMMTLSQMGAAVGVLIVAVVWLLMVCAFVFLNTHEDSTSARAASQSWQAMTPAPTRCLSVWFAPDEAFWAIRSGRAFAERFHDALRPIVAWVLPLGAVLCFVLASKDAWHGAFAVTNADLVGPSALVAMLRVIALGSAGAAAFCIVAVALLATVSWLPAIATGSFRVRDHLWLDIGVRRKPQISEELIQAERLPLHSGGFWKSLFQLPIFGSGQLVHSQAYVDARVFDLISAWVLSKPSQLMAHEQQSCETELCNGTAMSGGFRERN